MMKNLKVQHKVQKRYSCLDKFENFIFYIIGFCDADLAKYLQIGSLHQLWFAGLSSQSRDSDGLRSLHPDRSRENQLRVLERYNRHHQKSAKNQFLISCFSLVCLHEFKQFYYSNKRKETSLKILNLLSRIGWFHALRFTHSSA